MPLNYRRSSKQVAIITMGFIESYNKWEDECRKELVAKGYSEDEAANAEICADGSIQFKGALYTTSKGTVTPWNQSPYYTNWK